MISRCLSRIIAAGVAAAGATAFLTIPALAQDVIKVGAPLPLTGPLVAGGPEAETRLRSLGRSGQRQRRHQGRRQDLQGRDRLHRLCLEHAARGAVRRADDHRGQGAIPVRAVRLRRNQGGERHFREVRHADARADGVVGGDLRPGLQIHLLRRSPETTRCRCRSPSSCTRRTRTSSASPFSRATICSRWRSRRSSRRRSRPKAWKW